MPDLLISPPTKVLPPFVVIPLASWLVLNFIVEGFAALKKRKEYCKKKYKDEGEKDDDV